MSSKRHGGSKHRSSNGRWIAYETALTILTRAGLPQDWVDTQNNLAVAYRNRVRGDRARNQEKAIAHFEAALTVRTPEAMSENWAENAGSGGRLDAPLQPVSG
jgi:hypothetical protein